MQKIIDAHFHIFDVDRFTVEWLKEVEILNRPILLEEFEAFKNTEEYDLIGSVHIELDSIESQKGAENDYFSNLAIERGDFVKAVILYANMLDPNMSDFISPYCSNDRVLGVRRILHVDETPPGTCLDNVFIENVKKLGALDLHFEACMRSGEMGDLYKLAKQCPNTLIVLNHMGLPDVAALKDPSRIAEIDRWKQGILLLATLDNVVCKISGLSSSEPKEIEELVEFCISQFGPERIMFASNFPVCNLSIDFDSWTKAMLEIFKNKTVVERDLFFYKNAERIYKIK